MEKASEIVGVGWWFLWKQKTDYVFFFKQKTAYEILA